MAELLPDHLGVNAAPAETGDQEAKRKGKRRQVTSVLEWLQCYSIYMAVIAAKTPARLPDMLGYQVLIIEARMEYEGDGWLGYDRRFRQRAAASPEAVWARIEPTLWNIAFAGKARASRCKHCFSLTHPAEDCEWAPTKAAIPPPQPPAPTLAGQGHPFRRRPVCYEWNHNPAPLCPFPGCKYRHMCLYCAQNPQVADKGHKAMHCPERSRPPAGQAGGAYPSRPTTSYQRYRPY